MQLKPKDKVIGGERVEIEAVLPLEESVEAEKIDLEIVHEDQHVLVINKPLGLVVHPGAGNAAGTLQNALLHFDAKLAQVPRAGIVHRLDKDTSGLMVVARTVESHTALVRAIEAREVAREYEAICLGVMTGGGTVEAPIGRHPVDRVRMAIREDGREAVTHYRVMQRFRGHTHVRLQLETGRTHQIRVHMAALGYPLLGDPVYGRYRKELGRSPLAEQLAWFQRQALHAWVLGFMHPQTGAHTEYCAPLPDDLDRVLTVLRGAERTAGQAVQMSHGEP
jgi:23S rRNA pseudouridine1911/1915/1917 synthase